MLSSLKFPDNPFTAKKKKDLIAVQTKVQRVLLCIEHGTQCRITYVYCPFNKPRYCLNKGSKGTVVY